MIEYCKLIISLINVEFPLMEWFFLDLFVLFSINVLNTISWIGFSTWTAYFLGMFIPNGESFSSRALLYTISTWGKDWMQPEYQPKCWQQTAQWRWACTILLHFLAFMSAPHLSISCMPRLQLHLVRWELGHSPLLLVGSNLKNGRIRTNSTISGDYNSLLSTESIAVKSWNKKLIRVLMNTAWWDIRQLMRWCIIFQLFITMKFLGNSFLLVILLNNLLIMVAVQEILSTKKE